MKKNTLLIDHDKCEQCGICLICPGIQGGIGQFPTFNNLCSNCGGEEPACLQMCPHSAMIKGTGPNTDIPVKVKSPFAEPPEIVTTQASTDTIPDRLTLAIRGVGGQGTLFFGRVMTEVAFLAGYDNKNIVKGETHGMAQMGGPVISTFSCGTVHSPVLYPGSADVLIAMEKSEILRPGFLELLSPGGTILLAETEIFPVGVSSEDYPDSDIIDKEIKGFNVVKVDAFNQAVSLGDPTGRIANVVLIGALSKLPPFHQFPEDLWLRAVAKVSPTDMIWAANYSAFMAGRTLV